MRPRRIASSLATGRAPGRPRHTGQVRVFGGSPKLSSQPQNTFVRVESWTWISSPMTASWSATRGTPIEPDGLLERIRRVQDPALAEGVTCELEADRATVAQPVRNGDRRDAGQ